MADCIHDGEGKIYNFLVLTLLSLSWFVRRRNFSIALALRQNCYVVDTSVIRTVHYNLGFYLGEFLFLWLGRVKRRKMAEGVVQHDGGREGGEGEAVNWLFTARLFLSPTVPLVALL